MRRYEILVAGRIGPGAADLRAVLAVLRARGLAATFLRIAPRGQS